jgi:PAS domain S-box-containing protein
MDDPLSRTDDAEKRLRESEARYRSLFESMSEGFCIIEKVATPSGQPSDFEFIAANPAFAAETGVGGVVGQTIRSAFPGEPQIWVDTYDRVVETGQPIRFVREMVTQGRYLELYAFKIDDASGRHVGVIFQDITERIRAEAALRASEERLQVLVAELQHRTRNLLAVVRSVADKTVRTSDTLGDFKLKFRDRLDALARVQGLLSRLEQERVTFDELLRAELLAHGVTGAGAQITLDGPSDTALRSTTVQPLAMALHELATNAVKHGALSQPQAHLAVRWQRLAPEEGGKRRFLIDWRETGVAMSLHTARRGGAGRELIEHAIPHQLRAETRYVFNDDGVHCTIVLPDLVADLSR